MTQNSSTNKFLSFYQNIKNSKTVNFLNKHLVSPWGTSLIAFMCLISFVFSLEMFFYLFVGLIAIYVCIFADDLLALMPLFVFCYISPSPKNNPGLSEQSMFYGPIGILMIVIVSIAVLCVLLRIGLDKNIGYKKFFTSNRKLLVGMLILALTYFLSGIGRDHYKELFTNNIVFVLLQIISIVALYFVFTATVNWKKAKKDYFAWLGTIMGLTVCLQVAYLFLTNGVLQNGAINKGQLVTGWGMSNNVGALIALSIPFAFYLVCTKKHSYFYFILSVFLLVGLISTCSRASILCGCGIYVLSFIVTAIKTKNKKEFWIFSSVFFVLALSILFIFKDSVIKLFSYVPNMLDDNGRFPIYEQGWKNFLSNPIFGRGFTFYKTDYQPYAFSTLKDFNSFFPPRWHNTVIQILSSCGIVGMIGYLIHRWQTIVLFFKKPSLEKTFIGFSILTLLLMSLLDCHFFNLGPTLFYSMALAFAEKINVEENLTIRKLKTKDTQKFCDLIVDMYSHLENLEWFTPMPYDYESVKSMIENPRFYIIGTFKNNTLCGVSSLDYKCGKLIGKVDFPASCNTQKLVEIGFNIVGSKYRGKGLMKTMVSYLVDKLKTDNFEWVFAKVHKDNFASSKSILNNNFYKFSSYKKAVKIKDFKALSNQPFFSKIGKENAIKTLSKYPKKATEIVVDYDLFIKQI